MFGPRHQPLVAQVVQQVIHRRQRHQLAKLVFHELLEVETPERADSSRLRTLSDGQPLLQRQDRLEASPRTISQTRQIFRAVALWTALTGAAPRSIKSSGPASKLTKNNF